MGHQPSEATILRRIFRPKRTTFPRAAAEAIANFELPDEEKRRLRELAAKSRAGMLTPAEMREVEAYSRVGSLLSVMRLQARASLRRGTKSAGPK